MPDIAYGNIKNSGIQLDNVRKDSANVIVWFLAIGLSVLPILMVITQWDTDGQLNEFQRDISRPFWNILLFYEVIAIALILRFDRRVGSMLRGWNKWFTIPFMIWAIVAIATAQFPAVSPTRAFDATLNLMLHCGFAFSVLHFLRNAGADHVRSLAEKTALIFPVCTVVFGLLLISFTFVIGHTAEYDWQNDLPGFTHIRHTGYIIAPAIAFSLGILIRTHGKPQQSKDYTVHAALMLINIVICIWLGSRGPIFAMLGAFAAALIFIPAARNLAGIFKVTGIFTGALIASQLVPAPADPSFNALFRQQQMDSSSLDRLSSGRIWMWEIAANDIAEKPLVGHGAHQFKQVSEASRSYFNHPHNGYIQIIFDWGILGGGALLLLLALFAWKMLRRASHMQSHQISFFTVCTAMMTFALIDGVFFYAFPIITTLFCAAIIVHGWHDQAKPATISN